MKKIFAMMGLLVALFAARSAWSQGTITVTGTATDPSSTAWANGTYSASYVIPPGAGSLTNTVTSQTISPTTLSGSLDASGAFSITLVSTANVLPAISGVTFRICPQMTNSPCYTTAPILIGTTSPQSVSSQIDLVLQNPSVTGAPLAQAYNDAEVAAVFGNQYARLSDSTFRCYTTSWGACGGTGPSFAYPLGTGFTIVTGGAAWGTTLTDPLAVGHGGTGIATVPTAGQILVGNAGGTAYVARTMSGSCTIDSTGSISCIGVPSPLPINNGGTGTNSTLTGLVRGGSSSFSAAELSGVVLTSGSNATTFATIAADSVLQNASGSTAAPTAVAMPTCTTGADLYNTTTHAWSCVSTGGSAGALVNITGSGQVTATGCTQSGSTGGNCAVSGTTTTAVTFSVIPGTYQHLLIKFMGKINSGAAIGMVATANSDTTASHYAWTGFYYTTGQNAFNGVTTEASTQVAQIAGSSDLTSSVTIDIPFYANTTFPKMINGNSGSISSVSSGGSNFDMDTKGIWNSSSAITSITLTLNGGADYANGSLFTIYGIN